MVRKVIIHLLTISFLSMISASIILAFSINKEIKLGKEAAAKLEKEKPLSTNETWQRDIAELGAKFLPYIKRKEIPYEFKIINAKDEINAFTIPGGRIYFTERMWRIMTPDERAAIMAHEIIHSDQRHGIDSMIKAQQRAVWTLPMIILGGGGAATQAAFWGNLMITQRYSRKMEREADEMGIQLLVRSGFNPAGAVTAMKKLLSIESDENHYEISAVFASHPDTIKRIQYLSKAALDLGANEADLELKAVDDPQRLGNIIKKTHEIGIILGNTSRPLRYGEEVEIKKMLWDDESKALMPKVVAKAKVLAPGKSPMLRFNTNNQYQFGDIMIGDGIYPANNDNDEDRDISDSNGPKQLN